MIPTVLFLGTWVFSQFCPAHALDDSPAEPGAWGFRPSLNNPPQTNPPGFVWRDQEGAAAYMLQVATDEAFEQPVYQEALLPFNAHTPHRPLEAGDYYWRYQAVEIDGTESGWSAARKFAVTGNEPEFPKPTIDKLIDQIPDAHPRLLFNPERVSEFKEVAAGPLAEKAAEVVAIAEKLLENPPPTEEPPKYPEGIEEKGEEWKKIWWGNRTYSIAALNGAASLAFAYQLTGDAKYGKAARDIVMAFAEWDPKGSTNYKYNDEAAMPLLYFPSRTYSWARAQFSDADREKLVEVMTVRGRDCFDHLVGARQMWRPYNSHSNRAWHKLGELSIAFIDEIPEARTWLDFATTYFWSIYPVWGGADGGWHEGAAYWVSYLDRFMYWALASEAAFGINVFTKPFFSQTGNFGMYTLPPGTEAGAWGDQAPSMTADRIGPLMNSLAIAAENPYWYWHAQQVNAEFPEGYLGFLYAARARKLEPKAPHDLPESIAFRDTGLAVLNSDLLNGKQNVQLHFKSSRWGRQSHGYNSNNAFMLYIHGEPALLSTGRRDVHGSPHHVQWMWESISDNAILINREGQNKHSSLAVGSISDFRTSDSLDIVVGEAADSYGGRLQRWTRRIFFFKPHAVLIHDLLQAPEPATFQFMLHGTAPFSLGNNTASWSAGDNRLEIGFHYPPGLVLEQTNAFTTPPAEWANFDLKQWHLNAATTEPAAQQEFLTLISINDASVTLDGDSASAEKKIDLETPSGAWSLHLAWDNFVVTD